MKKSLLIQFFLLVAVSSSAQSTNCLSAITVISSSMIQPQSLRDSISIVDFPDFTLFKVSKPIIHATMDFSSSDQASASGRTIEQKTDFFAHCKKNNMVYKLEGDTVVKFKYDCDEFLESILSKWEIDSVKFSAHPDTRKINFSSGADCHVELLVYPP